MRQGSQTLDVECLDVVALRQVDLPGLEAVALPAGGVITIAIPDQAAALGHPLVVMGTQPIVVERLLPRGAELRGRSGSLALPG